jgi:diguanylate cyclase
LLAGSYNLWLVLTSLLVAMFASYTALDMAGRVSESRGKAARLWLLGGSMAMGIGIWSMHFLGMLAFRLPVPMGYDPIITLLSLLSAVAASAFALWMVCQQNLSRLRLVVGAFVMGSGICTMHYAGMAAMRMHPGIRYVPSLFLASVAIAVTASGAALWIAFRLRQRSSRTKRLRAGAAVVMGFAIAGMHYTGMAAAQFPKGSVCGMGAASLSAGWLAPLIIIFAVTVLSIALIVSTLDLRAAVLASSLAEAHQELHFLALHDSLTKLPNRALLEDRLDQEIEAAKRDQSTFSVLFLDLDGFKKVNDAFGHQVGDQLLVEVARRIRSAVRGRDTVARLGGDEFVLVAGAPKPADAATLAEKLIEAVQKPCLISGLDCGVSASIGISLYDDSTGREALLKNADAAMYHAKALGRNCFCFFEASMQEDAERQLQAIHDLRLAMARNEFVLYYQPKFNARSGEIIGVEALIRWKHATRGVLSPGEFLALAESIGLLVAIGEWTIQEASRQMREWIALGYAGWTIAVNLSAAQFNHPGLIEVVQQSLNRNALKPECLILEITESTAMRDPEVSVGILKELRNIGVRISIDDFGTGYSSLQYLKRLPAGELKIDRGFVHELTPESDDAAIIEAIVALGRTLNLEIVAEGVETVAQQEFLTRIGCNSLQGFLLGRPMPPEKFIAAVVSGMAGREFELADSNQTPRLIAQIPLSAPA